VPWSVPALINSFWVSVIAEILIWSLFAASVNLLFGYVGLLSFGHALYFGWASYLAAHSAKVWDFPPELAILTGAAKGSATGRTHLEPITKKLNEVGTDGLEEYCLMIWGLNKEHRDELVRTMTEKTTVWYGK